MMAKAAFFGDEQALERIKQMRTPLACKLLGRSVQGYSEAEWVAVRYDKMVEILRCKFANPALKELLLGTGAQRLAEASPNDNVWGIGLTAHVARSGARWRGYNLLGDALMAVREELNCDIRDAR